MLVFNSVNTVMIMGALIGGKSYNWRNYLCMVMVTLGIGAIMFYKKVCYCYALFYAPFNNT